MQLILQDPSKGKRYLPENEFIPAEVEWICDHEYAMTLLDVLICRSEMSMYVHHSKAKEFATLIAQTMARKYNWDSTRIAAEAQSYVDHIKKWVWF